MSTSELVINTEPSPDQVQYLEDRIYEFNSGATGITDGEWLAIFVKDERGRIVAGICGNTWGGCLEIRQFWVEEARRKQGLGTRLLGAAEEEARRRGCRQVLLTTFTFQAPAFYSERGFEVIAVVDDHPHGHNNLLMRKRLSEEHTKMKPKNTICLWFDKDAHEAARFYAATFPDSRVTAVHKAPGDYPSGKEGDVLTVEFTVLGVPCLGLNGGPQFKHNEAFSFQVTTDNQEETDRYWNAIVGNGGKESACGWCKDRWGLSWQITPRALTDALAAGGGEAKRAFAAMMPMKKIDIATIEAARRG